jgi:hypothetical protein
MLFYRFTDNLAQKKPHMVVGITLDGVVLTNKISKED